ncbi:hypothetical protein GCM10027341_41150 [Spirosoma knui]
MLKHAFCLLLVTGFLSCSKSTTETPSDSRDQYVGTYKGSAAIGLTSQPVTIPADITVSKSTSVSNGITLEFQGQALSATLNNNAFTIPATSATLLGTAYNLSGGTGTFVDKTMNAVLTGASSGTASAPFSLTFNGTK